MQQPYRILYLCTGNSARSILAEVLTRRLAPDRFVAYSAGSCPRGEVHPMTLALLQSAGLPADGLRSKSWLEFATAEAPAMDFIITVCDRAAGEACPSWPGQPVTSHWSIPDPAAVGGPPLVQQAAFRDAMLALKQRISLLTELKSDSLERMALRTRLGEIARHTPSQF